MTIAGDSLVRCCNSLRNVPSSALCVVLFLVQAAVMDYYLVHHLSTAHLSWISADAVSLTLLVLTIYLSSKSINDEHRSKIVEFFSLAWFTWLFINVVLSTKVVIIFVHASDEIEELPAPLFFGPNTLKTTIALGSCIFLLLLMSQHDAPLGSSRRQYIEELTGTVVFDILDTVDILDIMFDEESRAVMWSGLEEFILAVAILNLIIPTIPLYTLGKSKFGRQKLHKRMVYLHRLLLVLVINVPNLLIRMLLWHGFTVGISPFSLKNIILIAMTLYEFYEHKKEKFEEQERTEENNDHKDNIEGFKNSTTAESPQRFNYNDADGTDMNNVRRGDDRNASIADFGIESRIVTAN